MAKDTSGEAILEGFLCPICMKDLRTPSQLSAHFEEFHAEDKDILRQLRAVFGRAKNKILKKDDTALQSSQTSDIDTAFSSKGTPESGGIDLSLWGAQTLGYTRQHLAEFKKIRKEKIERFVAERNNILIRLDKLIKSGIYRSESTLAVALKARKDVERRVVPWENDGDVKFCRLCFKKFNVLVRRHHCRLCGRVFCGGCCDFINPSEASNIMSNKVSPNGIELVDNGSNEKSGIRSCFSCLEILQRYSEDKIESQTKPDVVAYYERLKMKMSECDTIYPKYIRMAESINIGETEYSLETAKEVRMQLLKMFEYIDGLSKKIQFCGTDGEKQPQPQTLRLQRQIRNFAANYLQEYMFTAPSLPTAGQYSELVRMREEKRARERQEEKQRLINASLIGRETPSGQRQVATGQRQERQEVAEGGGRAASSGQPRLGATRSDEDSNTSEDDGGGRLGGLFTGARLRTKLSKKIQKPFTVASISKSASKGWGPVQVTMNESPDPMMQQMDIIRGYIKQAKQAGKYEEVALFEQNLKELELEFMKQRQGRW